MSGEEERKPGFREKFLATRYALERAFFDEEKTEKKERKSSAAPLAGAAAVILLQALVLGIWFLTGRSGFSAADIYHINLVKSFAAEIGGGNLSVLLNSYDISGGFSPPLYYLLYLPFLKIFGSLKAGIFFVNLSLFSVGVFSLYSLLKDRGKESVWVGAGFFAASPFLLYLLRSPDPLNAAVAFAAASYAVFIKSEAFEKGRFSGLLFGIFTALGFMSHKMFFFYVFPAMLPFLSSLWSFGKTKTGAGFLFLLLFAGTWYVKNGFYALLVYPFSAHGAFFNGAFDWKRFFWIFRAWSDAEHLPLFLLSFVCAAWMYFAVFNVYKARNVILTWLLLPLFVLGLLFRPDSMYAAPALTAAAFAVGLMIPKMLHKYVLGVLAFFLVFNQSGLVSEMKAGFLGNVPVIGLKNSSLDRKEFAVVFSALDDVFGDSDVSVSVSKDFFPVFDFYAGSISKGNYRFFKAGSGFELWSDALILENKRPDKKILKKKWFARTFRRVLKTRVFSLYVKKKEKSPAGNSFRFRSLRLGGAVFRGAVLKLTGYDAGKKVWRRASLAADYASFSDIDAYGVLVKFYDFSFVFSGSEILPLKVSALKIKSAKITAYSIARAIEKSNSLFKNVEVDFTGKDLVRIIADVREKNLFMEWKTDISKKKVSFALRDFLFMGVNPPSFLLKPFRYEYSLEELPVPVYLGKTGFSGAMLEIK